MVVKNRGDILGARRIVIKVGSSSITGTNEHQLEMLVNALGAAHRRGTEVVLVSSGSIATGVPLLRLDDKPTDLATQQAAAAVGQSRLISRYQQYLEGFDIVASQVLLTSSDLEDLTHRRNAQRAFDRLLELRVLPIVNENDTVATHEIRFGDNDRLAALVAILVRADLLLLLSDIDALYTAPPGQPGAVPIAHIGHDDDLATVEFGPAVKSGWGTGGATTKVASARLAADSGVPVLMTATGLVNEALAGAGIGTWFEPFLSSASELTDTGAIATLDQV